MNMSETEALQKAIEESLWEAKLLEIEQHMKYDEMQTQMIRSMILFDKYEYCREDKHKNVPYRLVYRRLEEALGIKKEN